MEQKQTNKIKEEFPIEQKYEEKSITYTDKNGKERKRKVLEVLIDWEGKKETVQVKKMTWGERAAFTDKFLKIELIGEIPKTQLNMKQMQIQSLVMGLHTAPFPITEDYIVNELDGEIGEFLYQIIDEYNSVNPTTKKK